MITIETKDGKITISNTIFEKVIQHSPFLKNISELPEFIDNDCNFEIKMFNKTIIEQFFNIIEKVFKSKYIDEPYKNISINSCIDILPFAEYIQYEPIIRTTIKKIIKCNNNEILNFYNYLITIDYKEIYRILFLKYYGTSLSNQYNSITWLLYKELFSENTIYKLVNKNVNFNKFDYNRDDTITQQERQLLREKKINYIWNYLQI